MSPNIRVKYPQWYNRMYVFVKYKNKYESFRLLAQQTFSIVMNKKWHLKKEVNFQEQDNSSSGETANCPIKKQLVR